MERLKLILSLASFLIAINSYAQTCSIDDPSKEYALQFCTEIAEAPTTDIPSGNIAGCLSALNFQAFATHDLDIKINQPYWGRFKVESQLPASSQSVEWVLEFAGSWTDLDVFVEQFDGSYEQVKSGVFTSNQKKNFVPELEGNFIKLILPGQQTRNIFFLGKGERGNSPPTFTTILRHSDIYFSDLKSRRSGQALYIGFIAMMLLYNFIFYFVNRDRSYLYYSIFLASLIIYTSFVTGDLAQWIEPTLLPNNPQYLYFGKLAIYGGLIAYFAFLRHFLELHKLLPTWDRLLIIFCFLGIPWVLVDIFLMFKTNFSYLIGDTVTITFIGLFVFINVAFAFRLYRAKIKRGYFIVAGISALCVGFLLTAFVWIQSGTYSTIFSIIGSVVEVILFSLGLAYRQWESQKMKQEAYFELQKSNIEKQLERSEAIRLKELDELKGRLFTNLTHEFRTPLTVIMGIADNIKDHTKEKDLIQRNSKNLLRLVNQMLDLSKAEAKNLNLNNIQSDIVSYLRYLTESFYSMATDKGIRLTFYSEESEIVMDYDEVKIQHIIYNLLSNAIKFTGEDGKVVVHLNKVKSNGQNSIKIKVQDNGLGISSDVIPHLFDRFYQADNSNTRKGEGTGIGLTLTKELVDLMGGEIQVSSIENKSKTLLSKGRTEFSISLPILNNAPIVTNSVHQRIYIKDEAAKSIPVLLREEPDHMLDSRDAPSLLIIEDNPDIITYLQSILFKEYTISTARNGQLGIDKAIELIPDIIISDVMMPIKDGYEVCEILKEDNRTSHIPIILLTAKAGENAKIEGLKYGADAYLTKPFNKTELLIRLEKLVSLRQHIQEHFSTNLEEGDSSQNLKLNLSLEDTFIGSLKLIIESNLGDSEFGVTELAHGVQMSQMQMYRKLKALTGETPSSFLRKARLNKGRDLLSNTKLTISEIAYKIGFSDPNYFSRTFHKEFGKPPRDFRK